MTVEQQAAPSRASLVVNFATSWLMLLGLGVAPIVGGVGTFGWQIYSWLREGSWTSISIVDFLVWGDSKWAAVPTSWFGLWKALNWFPFTIAAIIFGMFMTWGVVSETESFDYPAPTNKRAPTA